MIESEIMAFTEDNYQNNQIEYNESWKLIIADDEEEIHTVTQMVLEDTVFENKKIQFISAFSGAETIRLITENPDTAVILLDVVMETDDAGLKVARYIREDLKNNLVRIILRTGQPGQAPERKVITEYDINDYKEKTELTAQKLYTAVLSSLRSYRDLNIIEMNKVNLEAIINNSGVLFETQGLVSFSSNVLKQLSILLANSYGSKNNYSFSGFTLSLVNDTISFLTGTGDYKVLPDFSFDTFDAEITGRIKHAIETKSIIFGNHFFAGYFASELNTVFIIYFTTNRDIVETEKNIIRIFSTNILAAYDNIILNKEIIDTQKEIILTLGEVVETRSKETAYHVKRVAEISRIVALKMGIDEESSELIRMASPMHDVGKIGIPDAILNKPAKLTFEEFELIKKHTTIGHEILKSSNRKILQAASLIALEHHEWWDGSGYPAQLKGTNIHIYSRITALVDVFDALLHKRSYKDAWSIDQVLEFIKMGSGTQFDPDIVRVFLKNIDIILKIIDSYPD